MAELILPLFPLNLVAFPGEKLNLHIFEPRYRQMINECAESGGSFIICPHYNGKNIPVGTEMKLKAIAKKYPNGKMDIRTQGIGLVKIHAFYDTVMGKLYPGAEYERLHWDENFSYALNKRLRKKLEELYEIMGVDNVEVKGPAHFRTFQVAHKVGFSFQQELEFLKLGKEAERQQFMLDHLDTVIPVLIEMESMKRKARLNGHFKQALPPLN